ncbi:linoleoyl-CoA desaturase [Catalinimonas alkaloidigena]|uniref:fatty acid desaturase family protein n=1 Tax=Catalinimonas alkaloidigena TaxID=1075417 RepID=UPI002404C866|nr:acyl-CoA desaturase [Catalinimonas alkaloidigena]MDF9797447.1 linoleoyl-CoA desaturase [Catalinimonas alkaloidigena]
MKFINKDNSIFFSTLRTRVNQYFTENNISRYGNREMVIKSVVLISLYLAAYICILTLPWAAYLLIPFALIMGIAKSGIGMTVMHDALHGSYSKNKVVNKLMGNSIYLLGANANVWKIQHNLHHHTYTNIHGKDEDINTKVVIRLSKHAPRKAFHAYQHLYVWFLYGLMTLLMFSNDFYKLLRYHKAGEFKGKRASIDREYLNLIGLKLVYVFFMLILPVLVTSLLWWQVLIGFLIMHLTAGFILSTIFQMAHIVEGTDQPLPNAEGNMENEWAIHQLNTTANFARDNRVLNWFIGGLNYQIEHHLFPNICHVHYRKISEIVEETAAEFQLPYNVKPTFSDAIFSHIKALKQLGTYPA